jgi:hypothetical protein
MSAWCNEFSAPMMWRVTNLTTTFSVITIILFVQSVAIFAMCEYQNLLSQASTQLFQKLQKAQGFNLINTD